MEVNMNRNINKVLVIILVLSINVIYLSCNKTPNVESELNIDIYKTDDNISDYDVIKTLPINYITASWVFEKDNLFALIGYVDYVFVGKIIEYLRTEYDYYIDANGNYYQTDNPPPMTVYKVEVLINIKNELNKNINIYKDGGLRKDEKAIILYEDSTLFNVNDINVFYGIAQPDGRLFVIGSDEQVKMDLLINNEDKSIINAIKNSIKYKTVVEAYSQEAIYSRNRSIAVDDINYLKLH